MEVKDGVGFVWFKWIDGHKKQVAHFKPLPDNTKQAMAELQKHLERIGKHPMAITAIMFTGAYGFAFRLLVGVF